MSYNVRSTGFSAAEKAAVTAACRQLIDGFFRPRFLPDIRPTDFNYPVDLLGKWHGTKYRFIQRYRSGFPDNLGDEFDAPFARLDWVARNRFDLLWHRHTGEWFSLYRGLTLAEAIETLKSRRPASSRLNQRGLTYPAVFTGRIPLERHSRRCRGPRIACSRSLRSQALSAFGRRADEGADGAA